jgi:hypothetical protein
MAIGVDEFLARFGIEGEDQLAMHASTDTDEFLAHFGVKGMKWGVRKPTPTGASRGTNREARKDATEYAKAKMFFGEGAGTRRKLIKATVEAKSTKDPAYKEAFDHHLGAQDMAKRASQARGERKRTDIKNSTTKNARSVHRILTGGLGNVTMTASVVVGAYGLARSTGADKIIANAGKTLVKDAASSPAAKMVKDAFKASGWIK